MLGIKYEQILIKNFITFYLDVTFLFFFCCCLVSRLCVKSVLKYCVFANNTGKFIVSKNIKSKFKLSWNHLLHILIKNLLYNLKTLILILLSGLIVWMEYSFYFHCGWTKFSSFASFSWWLRGSVFTTRKCSALLPTYWKFLFLWLLQYFTCCKLISGCWNVVVCVVCVYACFYD